MFAFVTHLYSSFCHRSLRSSLCKLLFNYYYFFTNPQFLIFLFPHLLQFFPLPLLPLEDHFSIVHTKIDEQMKFNFILTITFSQVQMTTAKLKTVTKQSISGILCGVLFCWVLCSNNMPLETDVLTNLQSKASRRKMNQHKQATQAILHYEVILCNLKTAHQLIRKLYLLYSLTQLLYCKKELPSI